MSLDAVEASLASGTTHWTASTLHKPTVLKLPASDGTTQEAELQRQLQIYIG